MASRQFTLHLVVVALLMALTSACGGDGAPDREVGATTPSAPSALGDGDEELAAGTHVLELASSFPKVELTVPAGWFNVGGWGVGKHPELPHTVAVSFWDVDKVYPTPCRWKGKPLVDPGPDVEGLAAALAQQPLRNATQPEDVSLAGFSGTYLELSVPDDVDFDDCDEGFFESWTAEGWATDRYQQAPGQVDQIWIIDVGGKRLVVDAFLLASASAQDRAELEAVVESIAFVE